MSKRRRRRRGRSCARHRDNAAEPFPSPWVECGGELYFAVDFTPAGFPIGLRADELDAAEGGCVSDPVPRDHSPRREWSPNPF